MTEAEIADLIRTHGLWLLFVLTLVEGPLATVAAAALAAAGLFDLAAVFAVAFAGDIVGDMALYGLGRALPGLQKPQGTGRLATLAQRANDLHDAMRRRAWQVLVLGKLTHVMGFAVLLAAGMARVPFGLFLAVTVLATLPKLAALTAFGYGIGRAVEGHLLIGLALIALVVGGAVILRRRRPE